MSQYKGASGEGDRATKLMKARQDERDSMDAKKVELAKDMERQSEDIDTKFNSTKVINFQAKTYGLKTLAEIRAINQEIIEKKEEEMAAKLKNPYDEQDPSKLVKKKKKKKKKKATLSFDEDEGVDDVVIKKAKVLKNPDVDTSFLPDREREMKEFKERERLRLEWQKEQDKIKAEKITITYSYWDGSGHRRDMKMNKGATIEMFLQAALRDLRKEFHELRGITSEGLIYIKEDLLIPSHYSFYDFIVTKARGKSGPLFNFDVHDDVRMQGDATVEKDESHAGKVILRSWYDANKHIFPANRWEVYDPEKKYGSYSIADSNKDFN